METGQIVISKYGHDKNCFMAVVGEKDGYVFVADGKHRKISNPKRKNIKHISVIDGRVNREELLSNKTLRRAIKARLKQKGAEPYV